MARSRSFLIWPIAAISVAGVFLAPPSASATGITKGSIAIDAFGRFDSMGPKDIQDFYGPSLTVRGTTNRFVSYGLGLSYALGPQLQVGASYTMMPKKYRVTSMFSAGTWHLTASRIMLRANYYLLTMTLRQIPTSFTIGAGAGPISLSGAKFEVEGLPGSYGLSGGGFGGLIEITSESHVFRAFSAIMNIGYQFGKIGTVKASGDIAGIPAPTDPLETAAGGKWYVDYSGLSIGVTLRFYLKNSEGSSYWMDYKGISNYQDRESQQTALPVQSTPPAQSAEAIYQESAALYSAANYDAAWAKAYAALQIDPNHWQSWQMIGNCQYAKGDKNAALVSYRKSLELNPNNPTLRSFVDQLSQ